MSRKYPRIMRNEFMGKLKSCQLAGCLEKTDKYITIQVSWFRGDDEVYRICKTHLKAMTDNDILRFCGLSAEAKP